MNMIQRIAATAAATCLLALPAFAGGVATPEDMNPALEKAFNAADKSALAKLYLPESIFISQPGTQVSGIENILKAFDPFLEPGLPLKLTLRHKYVAGDTAELLTDWVIEGKDKSGKHVKMTGVAIDILRKGPDGNWYFWIDNPHGVN